MAETYSEPKTSMPASTEDIFVPSYARGSRKKKSVRTWMILAPIGAAALLGGGAMLIVSGDKAPQPLVEEPAMLSLPLRAPVSPPLESSTQPSNAVMTPLVPAPVVREAAPTPPPAVRARRVQPVPAASVEAAPAAIEQAPLGSTGPTAYDTAPANTTVAPPSPTIPVAPLS